MNLTLAVSHFLQTCSSVPQHEVRNNAAKLCNSSQNGVNAKILDKPGHQNSEVFN